MRAGHLLIGLLALCCCYAPPCVAIAAGVPKMTVTSGTQKAAIRRVVQVWQDGRVDLVRNFVTQDYVGHTSSGDRKVDGLLKRISDFHKLYPDMKFTVVDQIAEGDRVATRMTAVGTSSATGQRVHLIGLNISRFVGNRIAEEWPVWEIVPPN